MPKLFAILFLLVISYLPVPSVAEGLLVTSSYAQSPLPSLNTEITTLYKVVDKEAVDGDILISSAQGLVRATQSYDKTLFGILSSQPLVVYRSDEEGKPVIRSGVADVNVTNSAGPINTGDYITSSEVPGKGQKAIESGYTIGVALESFNGDRKSVV